MHAKRVWPLAAIAVLGACTQAATDRCVKDTDCKGDRICIGGECVSPAAGGGAGGAGGAGSGASGGAGSAGGGGGLCGSGAGSAGGSSGGGGSAGGSGTGGGACVSESLPQFCARYDAGCGSILFPDNCGAYRSDSCGSCLVSQVCQSHLPQWSRCCTPESDAELCARLGKTCGLLSLAEDNCGRSRSVSSCGTCTQSFNVCSNANVCICQPETDQEFCQRHHRNCGTFTGNTLCGEPRTVASCGICTTGFTCGAGGLANWCGVDRRWPRWPMPDSATSVCSSGAAAVSCPTTGSGAGQDGTKLAPIATYSTTVDTVTDSVTQLMWQRVASSQSYIFSAATAYCDGLTLATYSDWRLPTRLELLTLVDYGRFSPAVDTTAFPSFLGQEQWTSSATPLGDGFTVDLSAGNVGTKPLNVGLKVLCVRGGS